MDGTETETVYPAAGRETEKRTKRRNRGVDREVDRSDKERNK